MKEQKKVRLKIAHADFTPGKEFIAEYDTMTDFYAAINNRNQLVSLNSNWVEEVFDVNYEENYKKEIAEIDSNYQNEIAKALDRYKKAKTFHLLEEQKASDEKAAREKSEKEKADREAELAADLASKEQARKEVEDKNNATKIELQAKAVTEAKLKVQADIDGKKQEVESKQNEVNKLEHELAQYETKINSEMDEETKSMYEKVASDLSAKKEELEISKSALDLTVKQLENIDSVSPVAEKKNSRKRTNV